MLAKSTRYDLNHNLVERGELLSLCLELHYDGVGCIAVAEGAIARRDYYSYARSRDEFERICKLISSPLFDEWTYAQETRATKFPEYPEITMIHEAFLPVTFTDGSTIDVDDDCDVPF